MPWEHLHRSDIVLMGSDLSLEEMLVGSECGKIRWQIAPTLARIGSPPSGMFLLAPAVLHLEVPL